MELPLKKSREFQVFVKPVGAECNLRCRYCYYLEKMSLYPQADNPHMNVKILEEYVIQHFNASSEKLVFFSWHGGEPLLAGLDFYRNVLKFQKKHCPGGTTFINGIQTNGTLLNQEWCRFLSGEQFIVGISIDGPEELHDAGRRTVNDRPSFNRVMNGYHLLKKYGIIPEILCVVNSENVEYPLEVYRFFRQLGAKYMTFLPLVERQPEGVSLRSVNPGMFGKFLSSIFDEWVENDIGEIKIQIFEEAARTAFNQDHTLCIFRENCGGVPVLEHNGDFYSCDHYVDRSHLIGNITDKSLSSLLDDEKQVAFGQAKSKLPQFCLHCEVRSMCNGECPKNRFISTPDGEPGLNYLCEGYRNFFNHSRSFVEAIAEMWTPPE